MKRIVDISTFDRTVNFKKVKEAGYVAVIIRAGYGQTNVDDYFFEHIKGAVKAKMPVGIYWFSYAWNVDMAKEEARKCLELIKPYPIDLPVFYDYEYDSDRYAKSQGHPVSNLMLNQMAVAFCSEIRKGGYTPGIYFNRDFRDNRFSKDVLKSYSQWYAYYNRELDSGAKDIDLWQYTSTGEVPGIPTEKEDLNFVVNESILKASNKAVQSVSVSEGEKYVEVLQEALKASYGVRIATDGKYGKQTKAVIELYPLYYTKPTIKNAHVSCIQEGLCRNGYMTAIDGSYGPDTARAVRKFQEDFKLIVDGCCGPNTTAKLVEVMSR